eukprot:TRINITY_DN44123_c0_g1_i1.p1 TRINITY_DN44123_c0_g1~~TRINITY_DN44123_c0_g1_i1.p1  ORF type:complete len:227 (+),score=32.81 TRINITY_DN44123_c0_g1_i1:47-682(+)
MAAVGGVTDSCGRRTRAVSPVVLVAKEGPPTPPTVQRASSSSHTDREPSPRSRVSHHRVSFVGQQDQRLHAPWATDRLSPPAISPREAPKIQFRGPDSMVSLHLIDPMLPAEARLSKQARCKGTEETTLHPVMLRKLARAAVLSNCSVSPSPARSARGAPSTPTTRPKMRKKPESPGGGNVCVTPRKIRSQRRPSSCSCSSGTPRQISART